MSVKLYSFLYICVFLIILYEDDQVLAFRSFKSICCGRRSSMKSWKLSRDLDNMVIPAMKKCLLSLSIVLSFNFVSLDPAPATDLVVPMPMTTTTGVDEIPLVSLRDQLQDLQAQQVQRQQQLLDAQLKLDSELMKGSSYVSGSQVAKAIVLLPATSSMPGVNPIGKYQIAT